MPTLSSVNNGQVHSVPGCLCLSFEIHVALPGGSCGPVDPPALVQEEAGGDSGFGKDGFREGSNLRVRRR